MKYMTTHNHAKRLRLASAGLLGLGFAVASASAQFNPVDVTFGNNDDGDGGFTTNAQGSNKWTVTADALNLESPNTAGFDNATAKREITGLNGSDFNLDVTFEIAKPLGGSDRVFVQLFQNNDSASLLTNGGLRVDYQPQSGGRLRIQAVDTAGTTNNNEWVENIGLDNSANANWTFSADGDFKGNGDFELTVTVSDGSNTGTDSKTVASSEVTNEWTGFGTRTGNDLTEQNFQSFSVVPEPSTYAGLAGLSAFAAVLLFRRRR